MVGAGVGTSVAVGATVGAYVASVGATLGIVGAAVGMTNTVGTGVGMYTLGAAVGGKLGARVFGPQSRYLPNTSWQLLLWQSASTWQS